MEFDEFNWDVCGIKCSIASCKLRYDDAIKRKNTHLCVKCKFYQSLSTFDKFINSKKENLKWNTVPESPS